jgi:sugar fermentation stimulation protein A
MKLPPLTEGTLIKRYKRFLADIDFGDMMETVHCPNPGAMTGLKDEGMRVWCSTSDNHNRKLKKTLEIVEADRVMVGINTNLPNKLVHEALSNGTLTPFADFPIIAPEFTYTKGTRFDFKLSEGNGKAMIIEVKNVHLKRDTGPNPGMAEFPDSVTARGAKHLDILSEIAKKGEHAAMLYVIQRNDISAFTLADDIDPVYAEAFLKARDAGVAIHAWQCHIDTDEIKITKPVKVEYRS